MPREVRMRKRRHSEVDEVSEEGEMIEILDDTDDEEDVGTRSEEEEDSDEGRRRSSRRKSSKKSKKNKKKKKKKHSHHRKRRHAYSDSEEEERSRRKRSRRHKSSSEEDQDTDREGGSTPELPEIDQEPPLEKVTSKFGGEEGEIEDDDEVLEHVSEDEERSQKRSSRRDRHRDGSKSRSCETSKIRPSVADRIKEKMALKAAESSKAANSTPRNSVADRIKQKMAMKAAESSKAPTSAPTPSHHEEKQCEEKETSAENVISMSMEESASVEETNELRAKLGLAPLNVGKEDKKGDGAKEEAERIAKEAGGTLIPNSNKNEVHVPAENLSDKTEADKIRERIKQRRIKREQESKLLILKRLGDSEQAGDSDDESDSTMNWIEKQKRFEKEKKEASRRAKMLEELDDEFGIGNLVEDDAKKTRASEYSKSQLKGLKVEHSVDKFTEGKSVILTLKDADILDDEATDTLVNVNIVDDEKAMKRNEDIKKAKAGYNAYDLEEIDEATGEVKRKSMLDKYDEEIDGVKKEAFVIGDEGEFDEEERKVKERERIRAKLEMKAKTLVSLELPKLQIASDYMTREEQDVKFKKPKKKKRVKRKMLKADDLLGLEENTSSFGSRSKKQSQSNDSPLKKESDNLGAMPMDIDDPDDSFDLKPDLSNIKVEDEGDLGLENALNKARRLQQRRAVTDSADHVLSQVKQETINMESSDQDITGSKFIATFEDDNVAQAKIILNETAEFCRNLGARQISYGGIKSKQESSDDDVDKDLIDFENSLKSQYSREREDQREKWSAVDENEDSNDYEGTDAQASSSTAILDEEPDLQSGVAAAIQLANSKGYWEKEETKKTGSNLKHLQAKNYTIDDKVKGDDDRGSRRERYSGSTQPFQEKSGYVPNVKLEYMDDTGRLMNQKEAFRYLSHKFHGKGSGKMKTEKRMKKIMEEGLMKNMLSTDTPLQTLEKLKKKQAATATPYVVLTGNKIDPHDLKKF